MADRRCGDGWLRATSHRARERARARRRRSPPRAPWLCGRGRGLLAERDLGASARASWMNRCRSDCARCCRPGRRPRCRRGATRTLEGALMSRAAYWVQRRAGRAPERRGRTPCGLQAQLTLLFYEGFAGFGRATFKRAFWRRSDHKAARRRCARGGPRRGWSRQAERPEPRTGARRRRARCSLPPYGRSRPR